MGRELFGTDGIRGVAGEYPLDQSGAEQVGRAVGVHFAKPDEVVLLGWDPRESSAMIVDALTKGLVAVGVHVEQLGILPTPGLAFLTREDKAAKAGIMVTASHNPYTDNGIKVFSSEGSKLPDDTEEKLNTLINGTIEDRGKGRSTDSRGKVKAYEDFLVRSFGDISLYGTRLAIDSANGATSGIASHVFRRLSATVVGLFDQPDGRNINDRCGATDTARLRQLVIQLKVTAGIAFDGDGDRLMLIDEKGRLLTGDHILYILALSNNYPKVVGTVMSNMGLENALHEHNIKLERTAVGDRYVLEKLLADELPLGAEQSGHVILPELLSTGDGLLAAVQVFRQLKLSGKSLADWYDELELLPQAMINLDLADKTVLERHDIVNFIDAQTTELGDQGRLVIRASGTQPQVRIMVEASDAHQRAQKIAEQLDKLIKTPAHA